MSKINIMSGGATKHVHELLQVVDALKMEQQQAALKLSEERSRIKGKLP